MRDVLAQAVTYSVPFFLIAVLFLWSDRDLRARRARRREIERKRRALERISR